MGSFFMTTPLALCCSSSRITTAMFLQIGRKRFQIATFEEASRMFCAARDEAGEGASRTPTPLIVDERGVVIGHVSYNGRVWAGANYFPDSRPLYDNRVEF
jgi:hypothetical protein